MNYKCKLCIDAMDQPFEEFIHHLIQAHDVGPISNIFELVHNLGGIEE